MQPNYPYASTPQQAPQPSNNYDFIMSSGQQPKRQRLPGGTLGRVIVAGIGLIILLMIFVFIKNLLSGPSNYPFLLSVAQDQTAIEQTVDTALLEPSLSETNKDFAYTTKLSMVTARSDMLGYMTANGHKVKSKQLLLKISTKTNADLKAAASASTYNEVFKETMKAQLTTYQTDLKTAYQHTKGPRGRELLSKQYDGADLLLKQLERR